MFTILDALGGAEFDLFHGAYYESSGTMTSQEEIGKAQLHNAITLLNKGYALEDDIDSLIRRYKPIETAPQV